jgi:arylsulfatase A
MKPLWQNASIKTYTTGTYDGYSEYDRNKTVLMTVNLSICLTGLSSLIIFSSCTQKNTTTNKPNIVFILADDLGYGDVSCLNPESKINTPNIDRIASAGLTFTDAHSASAVSTPTRYGILTGRYSWRSQLKSGVLGGYSAPLIEKSIKTLPAMLKQNGYNTSCIGKWHLGWTWNNIEKGIDSVDFSYPITDGPLSIGFDYFFGFNGSLDMPPYIYVENDKPTSLPDRQTKGNNAPVGDPEYDGSYWREGPTGSDFDHQKCLQVFTDKAINYITEYARLKNPYFLYLALPAPHTPIMPSSDFAGKSGLNPYADFVMMVDREVGKILNAIETTGENENTLIVFASDNGCSPWADFEVLKSKGHNPSYIFRGYKADLYEGGHHIPCILSWPDKIRKSGEINQTICLNDFMATFAEIIGYELSDDEAVDSYSLLKVMSNAGHTKPVRETTIHHSINGNFAIRKGDLKLILSPGSGGWSYPKPGKEEEGLPAVQLFNLKDDPGETFNLEDKFPDVVSELQDLLRKYIEEGRSTPGRPQANDGEYPWQQIEGLFN